MMGIRRKRTPQEVLNALVKERAITGCTPSPRDLSRLLNIPRDRIMGMLETLAIHGQLVRRFEPYGGKSGRQRVLYELPPKKVARSYASA